MLAEIADDDIGMQARIERNITEGTLDRSVCLAIFSDMSRLILFKAIYKACVSGRLVVNASTLTRTCRMAGSVCCCSCCCSVVAIVFVVGFVVGFRPRWRR
jgi:hypothetical protein